MAGSTTARVQKKSVTGASRAFHGCSKPAGAHLSAGGGSSRVTPCAQNREGALLFGHAALKAWIHAKLPLGCFVAPRKTVLPQAV